MVVTETTPAHHSFQEFGVWASKEKTGIKHSIDIVS